MTGSDGAFDTVCVNGHWIRIPADLRGLVAVDYGRREDYYFEVPAMLGLEAVLEPDSVFYDIGCSYGVFTCIAAALLPQTALIHAFEANPEVAEAAGRVVQANGIEGRVTLINACAGESGAGEVEFYAVPGKSSVASTRNAEILKFHSDARIDRVPLISLDDYCHGHPSPTCLKIDVEGSEHAVLLGAAALLEKHRPDLILETHCLELIGIRGSMEELCRLLGEIGYPLMDLERADLVTPAVFAHRKATEIGYLLASDRLREPAFVEKVQARFWETRTSR